jgi:putative spermidine/putrescine transport system substrate-binding protein
MAPQKSQDALKTCGRAEYDALIADNPKELPLDAQAMITGFDLWDRQIGASKVSK